jgi:hypothetical protein
MTKRNQSIGSAGEEQSAAALRRIGVEMVEKIGTPVRLLPAREPGTYRVIWGEKVSGDHRGLTPDGYSVLAETKTILDRNLRWSDLREHQPARLSEHARCNGISLLVWVHSTGIYIMRWPVAFFSPGTSITSEQAGEIQITSVREFIY